MSKEGAVILMSWNGGFTLGRVTRYKPRWLSLELRCYPSGVACRQWAVRCGRLAGAKTRNAELLWHLWLPVRTETAARMILAEIQAQLLHKREHSKVETGAGCRPANLTESQLRFLAKSYPRTVALIRASRQASNPADEKGHTDEIAEAYVEETFACTSVMVEPPKDAEQLLRMARLFAKMSRRKSKPDAVEREMIVGWDSKGYCRMTLPQLQEAIREAAGQKLTIDALRQKWKRLGLPSERRRGRRKATPRK